MWGNKPYIDCTEVAGKGTPVKKYLLTLTDFDEEKKELSYYIVGVELLRYETPEAIAFLFNLSEHYGEVAIDLNSAPMRIYAYGYNPADTDGDSSLIGMERCIIANSEMQNIHSYCRPFGAELNLEKKEVFLALCYDIMIIPVLRGKGLGSFLLSELIELMKEEAKKKGLSLEEIRVAPLKVLAHDPEDERDPGNKERRERLYTKLGFELTGSEAIAPNLAYLRGCYSKKCVKVHELELNDNLTSAIQRQVTALVQDWYNTAYNSQKFWIEQEVRAEVKKATHRPAYIMSMAFARFVSSLFISLAVFLTPFALMARAELSLFEKLAQAWGRVWKRKSTP